MMAAKKFTPTQNAKPGRKSPKSVGPKQKSNYSLLTKDGTKKKLPAFKDFLPGITLEPDVSNSSGSSRGAKHVPDRSRRK
jgi:hypothetical protein